MLYCVGVLYIFSIPTSTSSRVVLKRKQVLNKVGLSQKAFSGAEDFLQFLRLPKFVQSPFAPAPPPPAPPAPTATPPAAAPPAPAPAVTTWEEGLDMVFISKF